MRTEKQRQFEIELPEIAGGKGLEEEDRFYREDHRDVEVDEEAVPPPDPPAVRSGVLREVLGPQTFSNGVRATSVPSSRRSIV
jgi:hypothetical protein